MQCEDKKMYETSKYDYNGIHVLYRQTNIKEAGGLFASKLGSFAVFSRIFLSIFVFVLLTDHSKNSFM
jgi:hypothetical protein